MDSPDFAVNNQEQIRVRNLIYDWTGINISDRNKHIIASRLYKRLKHYRVTSVQEYLNILQGTEHPEEKQIFINLLTTNETYFFREYIHFEYLGNILKKLKSLPGTVRFWSAACSTGEEAFSMAMIAAESLGIEGNWEVIATDINDDVIEKAHLGIYKMDRLADFPREYLEKYCLKGVRTQENRIKIIEPLRAKVRFLKMNLNEVSPSIGTFHVIFLRNVLIYFDDEKKKHIVDQVSRRLKDKGYLVISLTESIRQLNTDLVPVGESYYQKPGPPDTKEPDVFL